MLIYTSHQDAGKTVVPVKIAPQVEGNWRWIGARTVNFESVGERFPMATEYKITVVLRKGAPSAEGPRVTSSDQNFYFKTFGPLKVTNAYCRWDCSPASAFDFTLSNVLDGNAWDDGWVKVEPSFPGMRIKRHNPQSIEIVGLKPGRRVYKVTLSADIKDEFGQRLEGERTFELDVGASEPWLSANLDRFVVLDPFSSPQISVFTTNYENVQIKAWSMKAEEWKYTFGGFHTSPDRFGKLVLDRKIPVSANEPDEIVQTHIDLTESFGDGAHLVIEVESGDVSEGAETFLHQDFKE